ncbi:Glycosyltransferase involved in cell wall bisynthesis [Bizionia echini]|uniref:Glycosyltransferase involved in cell wall bisynthesis n=1 Tax=Bizionia echini TaxID=649333 RepID=A0A1I5BCU9_9FLAO|nr:glycosyltransferase [Bizionia echini]SFN72532.1 Glycosyltransferase involved in cell wall bisynthesis [Bizionia echini]
MKTLTIISHTEHYLRADGTIVGLGSTVTEINELLAVFDRIIHVAMLHTSVAPPSAIPYVSERIAFVSLPAVGGTGWQAKLGIVFHIPTILFRVRTALNQSDYFQFRAPTGIGVFTIPYLVWFTSKSGWFKYAGNWKQPHPPLAYRFQKWLLEKQSRPVTINGFWDDQPSHCLSFENPCLTAQNILDGQATIRQKVLQYPIDFCFVGRLEVAKGLDFLLEALAQMDRTLLPRIGTIHIVGTGALQAYYEAEASALAMPVIFHGYLSRDAVHAIYKRCHGIVLPSASEGFPKVIAEAMNFGCVPIVSNVSSISHYVHHGVNGFLMETLDVPCLIACLAQFLSLKPGAYTGLKAHSLADMNRFSYSFYNQRLLESVL